MLFPQLNNSRLLIKLDGIWDFVLGGEELDEPLCRTAFKDCEKLYVPASYNDQKADVRFRDHYGFAYYQTRFALPDLTGKRLFLRFGAVTHGCRVYLNGGLLTEHTGGFLPFECELNPSILKDENLLTVAVDNRVDSSTLPVGNENGQAMFGSGLPSFESVKQTKLKPKNYPNFDFFNYCGIHRSVCIYTAPGDYIEDVTVTAEITGRDAEVTVNAKLSGGGNAEFVILDREGSEAARGSCGETVTIKNAELWQPGKAYLYTAKIEYKNDCYFQIFGVRSVEVKGERFLINGKPFYFKGFGKHEDSDTFGRGINEALNVKDISLMKQMGANSFRTSHYPYSEEMLNLCDEEGIVVIAETPAVGLGKSSYSKLFDTHKKAVSEMIERDKNHPCIVMWSLANEPDTECEEAYGYFKPLYDYAHACDPQNRPVTTVVCNNDYVKDRVAPAMDVICLNRYYGWYIFGGDLEAAEQAMTAEMEYFGQFCKPLMLTEYGADAVSGIHQAVPSMFSEEYQEEYYRCINAVLDKYSFVTGEHAWNFADFQTVQGTMRADGNKKGLFTRDRRPKLAAHYFRRRWRSIPDFEYK
jgi:beta-glucuronidase